MARFAPAALTCFALLIPAPLMAQTAAATPTTVEPYVREVHGDWTVRCLPAQDAAQPDPCEMHQPLVGADGTQTAEFNIFPVTVEGAAAGGTFVTPIETYLPAGIVLQIDDAEPRRYQFTFCNSGSCVAQVGFTPEEVDAMRSGTRAIMVLRPVSSVRRPVELVVSLQGFTAAFNAITN